MRREDLKPLARAPSASRHALIEKEELLTTEAW